MDSGFDVILITGILVDAKAKFGDLSKIIHKGLSRDEEKVSYVLESFRAFLIAQHYVEDDEFKPEIRSHLNDFCLVLAVNCEFSNSFDIEPYAHLTYNVPKISKYLLAKIIVNLRLTPYFCSVSEKLPLICSSQLFSAFIPCTEKLKLDYLLEDVYSLLYSIAAIIIQNKDLKYSDDMDTLLRTVPEFFFRFSSIPANQLSKLKKNKLYEKAGFVLQKLFNLLLHCHKDNFLLSTCFGDQLIDSTTTVVKGVPLDMFIYWAEIDLDSGQTLQGEIAENAYRIIGNYQNIKAASQLTEILKPFASKPKSIKELIHTADVDKTIFMVDKQNENQKQWFESLIFSPFFSNKKAVDCVSKWHHLCNGEDVTRILNESIKENSQDAANLAIKCASVLNLQDLIVVVTRHFYNNGFLVFNDDVTLDLIYLFNTLKDSNTLNEKERVQLLLIILQNPETSITFIFAECLKSVFYTSVLKDFFSVMKNVLEIHDIGLNCLRKLMKTTIPEAKSLDNHVILLQSLLDVAFPSYESLVSKVINMLITDFLREGIIPDLEKILKITNALKIRVEIKKSMEGFFETLLNVLKCRTTFMNHSSSKQLVVNETVNLINDKLHWDVRDDLVVLLDGGEDDDFILYYKNRLRSSSGYKESTLFQHFLGKVDVDNQTEMVCMMMKILPCCVTAEWTSICTKLVQITSTKYLLDLMGDMMTLLCEFVHNQEHSDNHIVLIEGLRYCVHQIGTIIQVILRNSDDIGYELMITELLVNLLYYLPITLKESEGLKVLAMMTNRSLKMLGKDKKFVSKICKIKDTTICKVLAQKILA